MIKATVTINDKTADVLAEVQRKALAFVTAGGQAIQTEAASKINNVSGNLASSIQTESFVEDGIPVSETGPTAEYGPFVEYGTGIFAVNGNGRQTPWWFQTPDGQWIRTRGGQPYPFMEPGYQAAIPTIENLKNRIMKL